MTEMARDQFRTRSDGKRFNQTGMLQLVPRDNGYAAQGWTGHRDIETFPTIKAANEWLNSPSVRYW